jgi:hypothetical protein
VNSPNSNQNKEFLTPDTAKFKPILPTTNEEDEDALSKKKDDSDSD